jgi:16S rRNA processing protein RimM
MDKLVIAEVLKPQGIRGELKIKTFTDFPEDVKDFKTVYIDDTPYKILSFRVGTDGSAYIGLRGIPDRNAAELMRGKLLKGAREDAPPLEEGQYYVVDVIGCVCQTEEGEELGVVKDISHFSSDIYTIEKAGKQILFPAVKGVIKSVNVAEKKVILDKKIFEEIAVL